jgi:hypothetical protein
VYHGARTGRCIAQGGQVLIEDAFGVKRSCAIEDVPADSLVWDGVEFVPHGGVVIQGERETVEWCGVEATPDHVVFIGPDQTATMSDAMERGFPIWRA